MQWTHKGIEFAITTEDLGPFVLASARVPREGMFVRVRPFSALGRTEDQAISMLKSQIEFEYRRVPEFAAS